MSYQETEPSPRERSEQTKFLIHVIARASWTVLAIWLIISLTFLLIFLIPDYSHFVVLYGAAEGGMSAEELTELQQQLAPDENLVGEYLDWMGTVITLDFGPIGGEIARAIAVTLIYLVPAIIIGFLGAVALGYLSASYRNSIGDYLLRSSAYLALAIPNFLAGALLMIWLRDREHWLLEYRPPVELVIAPEETTGLGLEPKHLVFMAIPMLFMAVHLMVIQLRYTRAESLEYLRATFVKTARAKGASGWRVARHVLRTAAAPLFTLFVVEVIGLLLVTIFVIEAVFQIPGIGLYAYRAVINEYVLEVLVVTMLFSVFILVADFLQDLSYAMLDPRITAN